MGLDGHLWRRGRWRTLDEGGVEERGAGGSAKKRREGVGRSLRVVENRKLTIVNEQELSLPITLIHSSNPKRYSSFTLLS